MPTSSLSSGLRSQMHRRPLSVMSGMLARAPPIVIHSVIGRLQKQTKEKRLFTFNNNWLRATTTAADNDWYTSGRDSRWRVSVMEVVLV
mmetsp:Transcript_30116/g.70375  ORF Transcript_30116/g.70375 Transcript_30116/m.70375 type:complete len:89 (-) Transcript_30116:118-384(-)